MRYAAFAAVLALAGCGSLSPLAGDGPGDLFGPESTEPYDASDDGPIGDGGAEAGPRCGEGLEFCGNEPDGGDICFDLQSDPEHCGFCSSNPCPLVSGGGTCSHTTRSPCIAGKCAPAVECFTTSDCCMAFTACVAGVCQLMP